MPHTNKACAPVGVDIPEFEGRHVDRAAYADSRRRAGGLELVAVEHALRLANRLEFGGYLLLLVNGEARRSRHRHR